MTKTAKEHWEAVQDELFASGEEGALELAKKLNTNYEKAKRELEKTINAFYGKYAQDNKLTILEVQKQLGQSELKAFKDQLDEYIAYAEAYGDNPYLKKLKLLKAKAKLSRLEELKANIEYEIAKLVTSSNEEIANYMQDAYEEAYLKTLYNMDKYTGVSIAFAKPNVGAIEKYLSRDINIANYSIGENGIWQKLNQLTNLLDTRIPQGLILGQNPKKVAEIAYKTLGTDYNYAVRLVRTEYNYTFNQATKDSYEQCGVKQYQVLVALDERTCDTCGKLDLLIQNYNNIIVGVNYPPFHPNCRCTTIPYFEADEFTVPGQRIARNKNGKSYMVPEDLTWKEWKEGLTEHEGGIEYWQSKGE